MHQLLGEQRRLQAFDSIIMIRWMSLFRASGYKFDLCRSSLLQDQKLKHQAQRNRVQELQNRTRENGSSFNKLPTRGWSSAGTIRRPETRPINHQRIHKIPQVGPYRVKACPSGSSRGCQHTQQTIRIHRQPPIRSRSAGICRAQRRIPTSEGRCAVYHPPARGSRQDAIDSIHRAARQKKF